MLLQVLKYSGNFKEIMADILGLSDVSSKDTGKGSKLKTGNLKRKYNMPKGQSGKKLSYKSIIDCMKSAKSDSDRVACKKHFNKKLNKKDEYRARKKPWPSNIGKATPENFKQLMDNYDKTGKDPDLKKKKKKSNL